MGNDLSSILGQLITRAVYFLCIYVYSSDYLVAAQDIADAEKVGVNLIFLTSVLTAVSLLFIAFILYIQLREFRLLRKQSEMLSVKQEEEPLPILNFYNGKVHNNGMLSVKLKNTGERISDIKFIPDNNKVDIRCGNQSLNRQEDVTLSFVPDGFNFSESYFEIKDLNFSINYKSILNDTKKEYFKMENPNTIFKIDNV